MPWTDNPYNAPGPIAAQLNDNMAYLKSAVDALTGATAPTGTIAWLGSSGAGSGYVMDGIYEKRSDGTWLWRPDLHGGLLVESNMPASAIDWEVTDGLSRNITKKNWEFLLTGTGTPTIVLGNRYTNSATIETRTVSERVLYGFVIPSGLTPTFQADTGVTLIRSTGSTVTSFSQAGPAIVRFLHGAGVWQEI